MDMAGMVQHRQAFPHTPAPSSTTERRRKGLRLKPIAATTIVPEYKPTPPDRPLRTPHSGYHYDGSTRRFFEGWYFKVQIPEEKQTFAWMYSSEDPAFTRKTEGVDALLTGPRFPAIGAQVLGPDDEYLCQYQQDTGPFWGSRHELALGNTFKSKAGKILPRSEINPEDFWSRVEEGFQVTPFWHQGFLKDDGRSPDLKTVESIRWEYSTQPIYGWGDVSSKQKSTAGWLASLPVFEPHWQICMAGGLSTGWVEWGDKKYNFENAPSYSEKNWGGSFPQKWFWVQCNVFEGVSGEIALTAGGGRRQLPLLGQYEDVAMLGVHYDGKLYEFVPWNGSVEWEISTWGSWKMKAQTALYEVELEATTNTPGTILRAPTMEAGLAPLCKDTFLGDLQLKIWECTPTRKRGKVILDVTSNMAALEVGGGPWYNSWKYKSESSKLLKAYLGAPIDVESLFKLAPSLRPPGL